MAMPDATLTVKDNALGLLPSDIDSVHLKIGVSSAGTKNQVYAFTDLDTLASTLGEGPLVEAAALALATTVNGKSGKPVLCCRVDPATAATVSAVTPTRVGTSTGTVATTGTSALDTYDVIILITRTGTLGAGAFKYSMDGGDTYSQEITIPGGGTYSISSPATGVVVVFTAGGGPTYFEAGDKFTFTTTAPAMTTGDLATSWAAILGDPTEWGFAHIVGAPVDGAALSTFAAAVATHVSTAEAASRFIWALIESPDISDGTLQTQLATFASARVAVSAGWGELTSPRNGRVMKRPSAWIEAARCAAIPVHEDPAKVRSGPVSAGLVSIGRDERKAGGILDAARYATLRTWLGLSGFYITNVPMMAAAGSDFALVPNRRVMDKACRIGYRALLQFSSQEFRVDPKTGYIDERDAKAIEAEIEAALNAGVVAEGNASSIKVQVPRTDNMLSTKKLRAKLRVVPLAYAKTIDAEIAFSNPALTF